MTTRAAFHPSQGHVPALVVGAGACGLTTALVLARAGHEVVVVERDPSPAGTTAMSTGLIPGVGSHLQRAAGVDDHVDLFVADILTKTKGQCDPDFVRALVGASGATIDWLAEDIGLRLSLVDGFLYPGHSRRRMHGMPSRSGAELIGALSAAAEAAGVTLLTRTRVVDLIAQDDGLVLGIAIETPQGRRETLGCGHLMLACCGFAGNAALVRDLIPELEHATFHGHPGNKGDAITWGRRLGAKLVDLGAYQGHAGLAYGHAIPILWPLIAEGGIQVNLAGARFADESRGYSEQTLDVLAQPGHVAWTIFDERRHLVMTQFADYQDALAAGCVITAEDAATLAERTKLDPKALAATLDEVVDLARHGGTDRFGRSFAGKVELTPPYRAAKVTGALFHTQGGLAVDGAARVLREDGRPFPNLFAGGGAARGISGPGGWGYLAGNGLLTATTLGRLAGEAIAQALEQEQQR